MASCRQRNGKYQFTITKKGHKPINKTFRTKRAGEIWAREIENDMEKNTYSDKRKSEKYTIKEACEHYEKHVRPTLKQKGKKGEVEAIKKTFGHYSFLSLQPEILVNHAIERMETVTGETVRKNLNTLKMIIDVFCAENKIELLINPVIGAKAILSLRRIKLTSKERDRRPTPDELSALIAFNHKKETQINLIVELAVETCMRRGEIAAMKRKDRRTTDTLYIPTTKTGKPREIPLTPRAQAILNDLEKIPRVDGLYWGVKPDTITQSFSRMTEALKIKGLVFHDLRHEGTSRLFEQGHGIEEVALFTGHSDWKSLKRYTNLKAGDVAKKIAKKKA